MVPRDRGGGVAWGLWGDSALLSPHNGAGAINLSTRVLNSQGCTWAENRGHYHFL